MVGFEAGTGASPKRTGFGTRTFWILGTVTSPKPLFKLILIMEPPLLLDFFFYTSKKKIGTLLQYSILFVNTL